MAIEKTLKTRIVQKIDTLANWESSSLPLKKGEIAFATATVNNKNVILAKIGDGTNTWKNTDYNFYANAADVGDWGKIDDIEYENGAINFYTTEIKYDSANNVDTATKVLVDSVTIGDISEIKDYLVQAGEGLTGGGKISTNPTIAHAVPTNYKDDDSITGDDQSTSGTFIKSITRDKFGHVTDITTGSVSSEITTSATGDGVVILSATEKDNNKVTITGAHKSDYRSADESKGPIADVTVTASTTADEAKTIKVPSLTADKYGHVKVLGEQTLSINIPKIPTIPDVVVEETTQYVIQPIVKDTDGNITSGDTEISITKDIYVDATNKHKIIEEKVSLPTKQYVDHLISSVKVDITDKPSTMVDDPNGDFVYAVTDLSESNNGAHKIDPTYKQVVTKQYVDAKVSGSVQYLGTVSSVEQLDAFFAENSELIPNKGDFCRVSIPADTDFLKITGNHKVFSQPGGQGAVGIPRDYDAHNSDILIYEGKLPPGIAKGAHSWSVIHGEADQWQANTKTADGFVKAGNGHANKVWKTDSAGNPDWMDDDNDNTTYDLTADTTGFTADNTTGKTNGANVNLVGSDSTKDTLKFVGDGDTIVELVGTDTIKITGTDRYVTEEQYHYAPETDDDSKIDKDAANSTEYLGWDSSEVVTGLTIQRDSKGHITDFSLDSKKMPVNPNIDTNTDTTYTINAVEDTTNNAAIVNLVGGGDGVGSGVTDSIKIKGGNNITISVDQSNPEVITITGEDGNVTSKTVVNGTTSKTYKADGVTEATDASEIKNKTYSVEVSHYEDAVKNASTTFKANTGLKLTSTSGEHGSITFDFDDEVEFIFDCGDSNVR